MRTEVSKPILRLIGLLLIALVGDRLGALALQRLFLASQFRYAQLYKGGLPADIVALGNSRGLHMFHCPALERESGATVANLSSNSLPVSAMLPVWSDYLDHHPVPKILLLEVSGVGRVDEEGALERFTVCMGLSGSIRDLVRTQSPAVYRACLLSHLYRFNSEFLWRGLLAFRRSEQDWIMTSVVTDSTMDKERAEKILPVHRDLEKARTLARIVQLAEEKGVQVHLIFAPALPNLIQHHGADLGAWQRWLESELGRTIVDYSRLLDDPKSFADPIHLNPQGASQLAQQLRRDGRLSVNR